MMILWTVLVFALVAAAIYWLATSYRGGSATATKDASAREILDQRLAKGELTIEQYQQLRDALTTPEAPATLSPSDGPQTPPPRAAGAASG